MSGGIGGLGQRVLRRPYIPVYEDAPGWQLFSRDAESSDVRVYPVRADVGALSPIGIPLVIPGTQSVWGYAEESMGGIPGVVQDMPGPAGRSVPELLTESKYVQGAVAEFRRLNGPALRASPRVFGFVVEILNHSVRRGYRPVVTVDEADNSLEIEARLDPNHLLLLQIWPSGATDGLVFSDREGFKSLEPTTVSGVVDWLVSSERLERPGH
jgi:hypothetical protein